MRLFWIFFQKTRGLVLQGWHSFRCCSSFYSSGSLISFLFWITANVHLFPWTHLSPPWNTSRMSTSAPFMRLLLQKRRKKDTGRLLIKCAGVYFPAPPPPCAKPCTFQNLYLPPFLITLLKLFLMSAYLSAFQRTVMDRLRNKIG